VLDGFFTLITKGTDHRVLRPTLSQSIGCPTPIINSQPNEEFAPEESPTLPDTFPRSKLDRTQEIGFIGRFTTVNTISDEFPHMLIVDILYQHHLFY
jgi:hypothetical protein